MNTFRKRIISLLVSTVLVLSLVPAVANQSSDDIIRVYLDRKPLSFDVNPVISNNRTLVPMRKIFEALGATVQWNEETRTVIGVKGKKTIELTIGADDAKVDGTQMPLDCPATIIENRTMVPLRFISESMGLNVEWDGAYKLISLSTFRDTKPDTWVAIDDLEREVSKYEEVGLPREDKTVGMFYYLWTFDTHLKNVDVRDITKIRNGIYDWGDLTSFHYWGEPFMGYYSMADPFIIRKHCQMLTDAGVDVLFFDNTNSFVYEKVIKQICKTYVEIQAEGGKTPKLSFMLNAGPAKTAMFIFDTFFNPDTVDPAELEAYKDLWFYWDGKPLMLVDKSKITDPTALSMLDVYFTTRASWAWTGGGQDKWPWLEKYPQKYGWHESEDKPEQISVATAEHPTSSHGKSYHDGAQPPKEEWNTKAGLKFAEQWKRALEVDPQLIFITQWNEWIAQRFTKERGGWYNSTYAGEPHNEGDSYFVDVYSWEFNRDIEPMRNNGDYGYGDNYYYQMTDYIRKYKGARPSPVASGIKTIDTSGEFSQWDDVSPRYLDDLGDTVHRDFKSSGKMVLDRQEDEYFYIKDGQSYYRNTTGRNDFDEMKVAYDNDNIYFYVKCKDNISTPESQKWMNLFLNTNRNAKDGFHGFDYMISRKVDTSSLTGSIERSKGGFVWEKVGDVKLNVSGKEMQLAIPRNLLSLEDGFVIDFKWFDNVPYTDGSMEIMDFIDKGDTAPNNRFAYQLKQYK